MAKNDEKGTKEPKQPSPFAVLRPIDDPAPVEEGAEPRALFEQVGTYTAKTSKQAIALAIGEHGSGTYVAVPSRSFVARKAEAVAAPRVKWS